MIPNATSSSEKYGNASDKKSKLLLQSMKSNGSSKNRSVPDERGSLANQKSLPMIAITAVKVPLSPRKSQQQQSSLSPDVQKLSVDEIRETEENTDQMRFSFDQFTTDMSSLNLEGGIGCASGSIKQRPSQSGKLIFPQIHNRGNPPLPLMSREEGIGGVAISLNDSNNSSSNNTSMSKKMKKQRSVNMNNKDRVYRYKVKPSPLFSSFHHVKHDLL